MSRIFSIYFHYRDSAYNALVSVRNTPFFNEYTINNFDEELILQLPGNKIMSIQDGPLFFKNNPSGEISPLMQTILGAVAEHLVGSDA
jgi:hypothetical protein